MKCQIFRFGFTDACEVFADGQRIFRFGIHEEDLPQSLRGVFSHDTENFLAAYALCRYIGISPKQCVEAYANFRKPPHRLQLVRICHGVSFYDDSKATNIEAVIRAVESLQENIILIAGGVHKGYPYHAWKSAFAGKVKKIFLIGEAAGHMQSDLADSLPTQRQLRWQSLGIR
jgi:UDP-N-acetylmuramoylalanine--D-glutamate ligase